MLLIFNLEFFLYTSSMLWFGCFEACGNYLCTQKPLYCSFPKLTQEPKSKHSLLSSPLQQLTNFEHVTSSPGGMFSNFICVAFPHSW